MEQTLILREKNDCTVVILAAQKGHDTVVTELLRHGADVNFKYKNDCTALIFAAQKGHVTLVTDLLNDGADVNFKDQNDCTALIFAAYCGHLTVVTELLKHGADVNFKNKNEDNALILAAQNGHVNVVTELLKQGADVNFKNKNDCTALILAAQNGHVNVVTELLKHGADVNFKDKNDCTALILAAQKGHDTVVTLLIEKGANVNFKEKNDRTALILSAQNGHDTVVTELLEHEADVNFKDKNDCTALILSSHNGHDTVVTELIKHGADVNFIDKNGCTALILAAYTGNVILVTELAKHEADVNYKDKNGCTPLIIAALNGHVTVVSELLKHGADVNFKDENDYTALIIAAHNGHDTLVTELLKYKADVNFKDENGCTALIIAAHNGHDTLVTELLEHGADVNLKNKDSCTALVLAAQNGHFTVVTELLKYKAEVNIENKNQCTALVLAAQNGHVTVVTELLKLGADVNFKDKNDNTSLILSAQNGHVTVVIELLKHEADVNLKNNNEYTALVLSAQNGHDTVVTELLKFGADVNFKDKNDDTALILSAQNGHVTVVTELLNHGADANFKDKDNDTALMLSAQNGHVTVVTELLKHGADANFKDKNDNTSLILSAQNGHNTVVMELLNHGADVNFKDKNDNTSLILSAQNGHNIVVMELLNHGADVNFKNKNDDTALILATENGHVTVVTGLLEHGADINFKNKDFDTPLHVASFQGHIDIVTQLLKHKADANLKNKDDDTALHLASKQGYDNIVEELLKHVTDVNFLNINSDTSLALASEEGHLKIVIELLNKGADVKCKNKNGETALHLSSRKCHVIVVEELLKHGAHQEFRINPFKGFYQLDPENLYDSEKHEVIENLKKKILQNYILNILYQAELPHNILQTVLTFFQNEEFNSEHHLGLETSDLEFLYKLFRFNFYGEFISTFQNIFKTENQFFISFDINLPGIGTIITDQLLTTANKFYDLPNDFYQKFFPDFKKLFKSVCISKSHDIQKKLSEILGLDFNKDIELFRESYKASTYLSDNETFSELQGKIQRSEIENVLAKIGGSIAGVMFVHEFAEYLEFLKHNEKSIILSANNPEDFHKELLDLLIHNSTNIHQHPYVKVIKTYENSLCPDELKLQGSGSEGFLIYRNEKSDLDFIYALKIFNTLKLTKLIECPDAPAHVRIEMDPSVSKCRNEQNIDLKNYLKFQNGKYYFNITYLKQLIEDHINNQLTKCPPDFLVLIETNNIKCFRIQFIYNVILAITNQISQQISNLTEFTQNILPNKNRFKTYLKNISGNYYVSQLKWEYFQTLCSVLIGVDSSNIPDIPNQSKTSDLEFNKFHIDSVIEDHIEIIIEHFNSSLQLLEYTDENFKFLVNLLEDLFYLQMLILISWGLYTIIPVIKNKKLFCSKHPYLDDKMKFIFSEKILFSEDELTQILDIDELFICDKEITPKQKTIEIKIIAAIIHLRHNLKNLFYKKIKKSKSGNISDLNMNQLLSINMSWHSFMIIHVIELFEIIKSCIMFNNIDKINAMEDQEHVFEVIPGLKFEGWPITASAWISRHRSWPEPDVIDRIVNNYYYVVFKSSIKDDSYDGRLSFSEAERELCQAMTKDQSSVLYFLKDQFKLMKSKHITSYHIKTLCFWVFETRSITNNLDDIKLKYIKTIINKLFKALKDHRLPHYFIPEHNLLMDLTDDDYEDINVEFKYWIKTQRFGHSDVTSGQAYSRGDTTNIEFLFHLVEKSFYQSIQQYFDNFQI